MNDDRCYHVPTSPGQTVCTCLDYTMWLRFVVQVQAEYIADLERRMQADATTDRREADGSNYSVMIAMNGAP